MSENNSNRRLRNLALKQAVRETKREEGIWHCCGTEFKSIETIGRHVGGSHQDVIQRWQDRLREHRPLRELSVADNEEVIPAEFQKRRAPKGGSDPIKLECTCDPGRSQVILFYKYVEVDKPADYAKEHVTLCERLELTGKVRIGTEGINATLAGSLDAVEAYLDWITDTPLFADSRERLSKSSAPAKDLSTNRYLFFKPSQGCRHVFSDLSVKVVKEICPLGRPWVIGLDQLQDPMHGIGKLPPHAFHEKLLEHANDNSSLVLDTRNYYESRIGAFEGAITPPIRKFSRFPDYVDRNKEILQSKKTIFTYCTGGIRCEKATAYLRHALDPDTKIFMLDGGIHNYIEWCKTNKGDEEKVSLWRGKNYVFDARQGLSLPQKQQQSPDESGVVARCQGCSIAWDDYRKCTSLHCHLLILYCPSCVPIGHDAYCCSDCQKGIRGDDGVCACERQRRIDEMKPLANILPTH
ncbi:hypothetical protein BX666DRAFT_1989546 [Dichotomocladium elegans]|nr:hypothetical protein BX666DRAFT_1989546 [Dichotomocladium elegans]